MTRRAEAGRVLSGGVEIAYDVTGSGAPVVLVHGLTGSRHTWDDVLGPLAAADAVVRVELRGHGASGTTLNPDGYSLDALGADVLAVTRELGLGATRVVGHSLGGAAVLHAALADPDAFSRIALVNSWAGGPLRGLRRGVRSQLHGLRRAGFVRGYDRAVGVRAADPLLGARHRHDTAFAVARRREIADTRPEAYVGVVDGIVHTPPPSDAVLAGFDVPVLFVCGDMDEPFAAEMARLARVLPNCSYLALQGSGHTPMFDDPGTLARVLADWLRVDSRSAP